MSIEDILRTPVMIKGKPFPRLIQGGMGAGVSLMPLASAVAQNGGIGTLSSVAMGYFVAMRLGINEKIAQDIAVAEEVWDTKDAALKVNPDAKIAINIMCRLYDEYEPSVKGAIEGGVDMIISGAGLPIQLPTLVNKYAGQNHDIALVPMISGGKSLKMLMSRRIWGPGSDNEYIPDALVLEGPKAGGHLGWSYKHIQRAGDEFLKKYDLFDVLLPEVLEILDDMKLDIPVYVAGGIWDKEDALKAFANGASGVQVGTPFAVCRESSANTAYKNAVISATNDDLVLGTEDWGSACNFPFRYLKDSPMAVKSKGTDFTHFCICTGLFNTASVYDYFIPDEKKLKSNCPEKSCLENGKCKAMEPGNIRFEDIYTAGTNATKVTANPNAKDGLYSAKEVIQRLGF